MEETRKSPNKKMVITVGGGGGIGAVLLLGGALATAALASVIAVRRKRRSSGEDSSREIKKSEDNITSEGGEDVGLKNDSTAVISDPRLKLDDKAVSEENPFLGEKFKVEFIREDVSKDGEVKGTEAREENSEEFEKAGNNGEEKCVEKTILPVFEEEGVEMVGVDDEKKEREREKENGGKGSSMQWKAEWYDEVGGKTQEDRVDDSSSKRRLLSCSCFFQLSFAKLVLFLFFALFLLEIYGFSLLNRHHLHATNKDRS